MPATEGPSYGGSLPDSHGLLDKYRLKFHLRNSKQVVTPDEKMGLFYDPVIASAAKQSVVQKNVATEVFFGKTDCFASLAMTRFFPDHLGSNRKISCKKIHVL